MNRTLSWLLTLGTATALLACGNDDAYGPALFRGDVDVRQCDDDTGRVPTPSSESSAAPSEPRVALAVCGDLEADNTLTLNAGTLAVDGRSRLAAPLRVSGGSYVGFGGIEANNTEDVDLDLSTAGDWRVAAPATIGRDAMVMGALDARNTVSVSGVLHAAGSMPDLVSAARFEPNAPAVANPLDCDAAPRVAAAIGRAETDGVVDYGSALSNLRYDARVRLGCARYRFDSFGVEKPLTLRVSGRTTIVVAGDVRIAAPLRVEVDGGASLELLIGGDLEVDNTLDVIGAPTWIGVAGRVRVAAPVDLSGVLYAPHSDVGLDNTLEVRGALCVGRLRVAAPLDVRAVAGVSVSECLTPAAD